MIAVIDYEVGNVKSVAFALDRIGMEAKLTRNPDEIAHANGIILPGVGAFSTAMNSLKARKLDTLLKDVTGNGTPLLGICLGHQILFSAGEEHGHYEGLDLLPGQVARFRKGLKVPHMGWNEVHHESRSPIFDGIPDNSFFYFAHSYYARPEDISDTIGTTDYGTKFASAVNRGNVFGTQFHPEKSGEIGLQLLRNFCKICGQG
jgi:glutamine amidotransferase